ncbi:DNA-binding protein [Candidatus Peregrinibacteria bacterium CG10_big_fil_rev_8_21_14_0_10_49_10]|nr:MAG: DNA-binding protein [Candidatus Peregrinibacteria bacterium CG10_big_fil_rev_8_21_14_0_10_49_10]
MENSERTVKGFHSLSAVAERLGLSRMTVYRYVIAKKLPAYKFGHHYRVKQEDLDAFVASHKI